MSVVFVVGSLWIEVYYWDCLLSTNNMVMNSGDMISKFADGTEIGCVDSHRLKGDIDQSEI